MGRAIAIMIISLMVALLPGVGLGLTSDPDEGAIIGAGVLIMPGLFLGPAVGGWVLEQRAVGLRRTVLAALVATPPAIILVTVIFALSAHGGLDLDDGIGDAVGLLVFMTVIWGVVIVGGAASGASLAERHSRPAAR